MKTKFISRPNFSKQSLFQSKIGIVVACDLNNEELNKFITTTMDFLNTESTKYNIFIIDENHMNYNKNKLYNIGYHLAKNDNCDFVIFHNENILPNENMLGYYITYPTDPRMLNYEISSKSCDILSINLIDFEQCGGFNMSESNSKSFIKKINNNNMTIHLPTTGNFSLIENNSNSKKYNFKKNNSNLDDLKYTILEHQILNETTSYYYVK